MLLEIFLFLENLLPCAIFEFYYFGDFLLLFRMF
jgi:hypothetical protein